MMFYFLSKKIKHHGESGCYVLYHACGHDITNIYSFEDYKQWLNDHSFDDRATNDGYQEILQIANNTRNDLAMVFSSPPTLSFEYNDHVFKLFYIDDFELLETMFAIDEINDYIDAFFALIQISNN